MTGFAEQTSLLPWDIVASHFDRLHAVDGGYSHAIRGLVHLETGEDLFVKQGVDESTKNWAGKEIETYLFLSRNNYRFIPRLRSVNDDLTGFAIDALLPADGWDWTNTWSDERLTATLEAMDSLAAIIPDGTDKVLFATTIDESKDGWRQLAASVDSQNILIDKLTAVGKTEILDNLDVPVLAASSSAFIFDKSCLVHNDVRADNCAWHAGSGQIRLVDWNWTQIGDSGVDVNALLVNVQISGYDVRKLFAERLDKPTLMWLAGYWWNASTQPMWPGAPEKSTLRDYQLKSGTMAYSLAMYL